MRARRIISRGIVLVVALASTALAASSGASAEPLRPVRPITVKPIMETPQIYRKYVALGDSYSAGPGIPWLRLSGIGCVRSTNNYPAWLADNLGIGDYTDVTCSAADTTNMTGSQAPPLGLWVPPQLDALTSDTDLVTIGIGGNDLDLFGDLTGTCPTLTDTDPTGSPCREHYTDDGTDTIMKRIKKIGPRVEAVLEEIHERAPQARVMLVGYLRFFPPEGSCPDVLPFADGDLSWLNDVEIALNRSLAQAANADGNTTYVDTFKPSLGHDACAGDDAWIQGQHDNLLAAVRYHPFKAGMVAEAAIIQRKLEGKPATSKSIRRAIDKAAKIEVPDSIDRSDIGDAQRTDQLGGGYP